MVKHGHDIHYMLVVLILAFFVLTLSINKVSPELATGQVVNEPDQDYQNFLKSFVEATTERANIRAIDVSGLVSPINLEVIKYNFDSVMSIEAPEGNIGGQAVRGTASAQACEWVNVDNRNFDRYKSMSGYSVCRTAGYDACMMTTTEKTTQYFESEDGTCSEMIYKDESSSFSNCYERMQSSQTPCATNNVDFKESSYTTVFCCK